VPVTVSTPVIAASDLTKRYGEVTAVDRVSLRVGAGEIYALVGLNGAGKTTTFRMLLGMVRPDEGEVSLFGGRIGRGGRSVWAGVGYLVETPAAYPELTVRENLEAMRRLRKLPDRKAVGEVIDRLALTPYSGRRARTLSLGNAQRLGLAKALIHHPDLLILDEPANGLDPAGVVEIRNLLRDLAHDGVTIVLSSHVLAEVARLATRIGFIHAGRMVEEVDADDVTRRLRPRLAVSAADPDAACAALRAAGLNPEPDGSRNGLIVADDRAVRHPDEVATVLVSAGSPPTRLVVERDDLETYFLRLVGAAPKAADD
jgi:ABC-2 type transport system ATP-binding protein